MTIKGRKPIPVRIVHDGPSEVPQYKQKDSMHISVRQIQNGFIVNKHGHKAGKHYDDEYFTPTAPKIDAPRGSGRGPSRNDRLGRTKI